MVSPPESESATSVSEPMRKSETPDLSGYTIWAGIFIVGSIVFACIGAYTMYAADRIVGGDAYNYIILAARGVAYVCIGIICAVIACLLVLLQISERVKAIRN